MSEKINDPATEKTNEELPVCTKPFNPESQRMQDDDEPCTDGENRQNEG